jgi:Rod binding domain-containing protein
MVRPNIAVSAQGCASDSDPLFFMDIKSIKPKIPTRTPPSLDDQIHKAAKMYEQQFLQEMMQAMRKTVQHTNEPSMAEKIYADELNSQYVEKWADSGGNGLADLIYKELKEKILPSQHSRYLPKPTAPVPAKDPTALTSTMPASPVQQRKIQK